MGYNIFAPMIAMSNFILIAYNFTNLKDIMPMWTFAIIAIALLISSLIVIGLLFQRKQHSTDLSLAYERNIPFAKTMIVLLRATQRTIKPSDKHFDELQERINYHLRIVNNQSKNQ